MSDNTWQQFLTQRGAHWDAHGVSHFGDNPHPNINTKKSCLIDLSNWSALTVSGKDARNFLQGQVTCDMAQVNTQHWLRGANCNIKGRAVFSFYCAQLLNNTNDANGDETFVLVLPTSIATTACEGLKKYAVFSKVSINVADNYQIIGLIINDKVGSLPTNITFNGNDTVSHQKNGCAIKFSDNRYLVLVKKDQAQLFWQQRADQSELQGYPAWTLANIRAGFADIESEISSEFIPQLLNFHLTNGISFKKGCYLGQEIVARMEYRGSLKRHMHRAQVQASNLPALNAMIYGNDNLQNVGNVVSAVQIDADSIELLVVITDSAFNENTAFLDQQKKHKLDFLPLPYAITK